MPKFLNERTGLESTLTAKSRLSVKPTTSLFIENASEQFLAPSASCPEAFPIKASDFPDTWMLGVVRERCGQVLACCQNRFTTRPELPRVIILEVRRPRSALTSVIDQAIRQIAPPATMNGSRPWSRSPPPVQFIIATGSSCHGEGH